jgi:glycosyltransferase involved in cell wall biosynthesis
MMANIRIVFAGMVDDKLKLILEKKIQEIAPQIEFIHYLGFQNYESMRQLFSVSNFVLLPYSNINQSSGILGWSVKYKVPIVTSANGFLGKIVGRYSIGYLLPSLNVCEISRFINNSAQHQLSLSGEKYSVDRSSKIFSSIILNND